ncbi:MAG: hypothetical protein ACI3XM_01520, partial [Eubacteriales bacterium]
MKRQLSITWDAIDDPTGYLFSFAKSLAAVVRNSPWAEYAEDIVASSGFAFRMWVARDLCPSATSIWEFAAQKPWVENGGFTCDYVQRLWGEDAVEEERREEAIAIIKTSVNRGCGAVAWDISGCEWGVITGYRDEERTLTTLKLDGTTGSVPYSSLGKLELPILSVLTVTGRSEKSKEQIAADTIRLAAAHLRGEEWCDNAKGLGAYPVLIDLVEKLQPDSAWNLSYYLGTYAALKQYAVRFLGKYGYDALAAQYAIIADAWMYAF